MARKASERLQAVAFVAVLVVVIAGLYAAVLRLQPASVRSALVRDASLSIDGSGWSVKYRAVTTANNTAFAILMEASHERGFSVTYVRYEIPAGVFVTGINGSLNGEGGRYWQYWVNGVYGNVASDHQALQDGATVLWSYSSPREAGG
jgi:hypothetical protein